MGGAGRPRSPGSSYAIDGDLKGLADLAHACSAERADPLTSTSVDTDSTESRLTAL